MTIKDGNKRNISGPRLVARCEFELPHVNIFSSGRRAVKAGNLVFNSRGGCLYVADAVDDAVIEDVFSPKRSTVFKTVTLFPAEASPVVLRGVGARFLRARREMTREGMVFRFVNVPDEAFETLNSLSALLPEFDPGVDFPTPQEDSWREVGLVPTDLKTGTNSYRR